MTQNSFYRCIPNKSLMPVIGIIFVSVIVTTIFTDKFNAFENLFYDLRYQIIDFITVNKADPQISAIMFDQYSMNFSSQDEFKDLKWPLPRKDWAKINDYLYKAKNTGRNRVGNLESDENKDQILNNELEAEIIKFKSSLKKIIMITEKLNKDSETIINSAIEELKNNDK